MYHSLKIKILDLDHIESIVEQDITDVEAEKIVGGTIGVSGSGPLVVHEKIALTVSNSQVDLLDKSQASQASQAEPIPICPLPEWLVKPSHTFAAQSRFIVTNPVIPKEECSRVLP